MRSLVTAARTVFATPAAFGAVAPLARTKPILFTERVVPESLHPLRHMLEGYDGRARRPRAVGGVR